MKLVAFNCPSCGAHLDVDVDNKTATCQFCGATFPVEDETQTFRMDGAAQAGYEFEKGRQRAQAEAAAQQQPYTVQAAPAPVQQPAPPKKKRKTWLWVLGWIFIFPVPLTIIMLRKKNMKPALRYGIIAVAWIIYLAIGLSGGNKKSDNKTTDTSSKPAATQEAEQTESKDEQADAVANVITIKAGEANEYSDTRTLNKGTEFEETAVIYNVPAGTYEVENVGKYRAQVNVYKGVKVTAEGWEEVESVADGTPVLLDKGEKGTVTIPDGYYLDLTEPAEITLTPKA